MTQEIKVEAKVNEEETKKRLEDIRSMMDIGHKSIRIEKHTFFLLGDCRWFFNCFTGISLQKCSSANEYSHLCRIMCHYSGSGGIF